MDFRANVGEKVINKRTGKIRTVLSYSDLNTITARCNEMLDNAETIKGRLKE